MNWYDFTLLAVLAISVIISFFRGFIREAFSLCIWVAAFLLAFHFMEPVGIWLHGFIKSMGLANLAAFLGIFLVVFLLGVVLNFFVKAFADRIGLGAVDKLLGFLFGAARGVLAVAMISLLITMSPMQESEWFMQSKVEPYVQPLVAKLQEFLPEKFHEFKHWVGDDKETSKVQVQK